MGTHFESKVITNCKIITRVYRERLQNLCSFKHSNMGIFCLKLKNEMAKLCYFFIKFDNNFLKNETLLIHSLSKIVSIFKWLLGVIQFFYITCLFSITALVFISKSFYHSTGDCPSGTYYENNECKLCHAGTYQSTTGKSGPAACIKCPPGTSSKAGTKKSSGCKGKYANILCQVSVAQNSLLKFHPLPTGLRHCPWVTPQGVITMNKRPLRLRISGSGCPSAGCHVEMKIQKWLLDTNKPIKWV